MFFNNYSTSNESEGIGSICFRESGTSGSIEGGGECYGHSLIIDPWGKILADGGVGSGIISAKINTASVKETREKIPSLKHDRDFELKIIDATKEI